jgi:hypothetical protein
LNHVQIPADQKNGLVNHQSSVEAKITLFRSLFRGREDVYLGPMPQHYDPRPGFAAFPQPEYELYESEMQQHPIPQARAPMPELPNVERLPSYNDCLMINELFEQTMKECIAYPDIRETIPDDHDVRDQGIMNSQDTLEDLVADHSLQDPMQEIEAAFDQQMQQMEQAFAEPMKEPEQQPPPEPPPEQMYEDPWMMNPFGMPGMGPGPMM